MTKPDLATMLEVRSAIDALDDALIGLLAQRVALIENAARIKARIDMPANIPSRVEEVVAKVRHSALRQGFSPELAEDLWRKMISWSIALEESHLNKGAA